MRLINLLWQNWSFSPPNHWTLRITLTYHYSFTRNYTGRKGKTELQRNPFGKILLTLDWLMWVLWPSSLSHFAVAHITMKRFFTSLAAEICVKEVQWDLWPLLHSLIWLMSSTKRKNSFTWVFQVCSDWMLAPATIQPWPTNSNLLAHLSTCHIKCKWNINTIFVLVYHNDTHDYTQMVSIHNVVPCMWL
jgi:hypothetical protein